MGKPQIVSPAAAEPVAYMTTVGALGGTHTVQFGRTNAKGEPTFPKTYEFRGGICMNPPTTQAEQEELEAHSLFGKEIFKVSGVGAPKPAGGTQYAGGVMTTAGATPVPVTPTEPPVED